MGFWNDLKKGVTGTVNTFVAPTKAAVSILKGNNLVDVGKQFASDMSYGTSDAILNPLTKPPELPGEVPPMAPPPTPDNTPAAAVAADEQAKPRGRAGTILTGGKGLEDQPYTVAKRTLGGY